MGMDALSVSIGIGIRGVKRTDALRIGFSFGLYQVLMPVVGMVAGGLLGRVNGNLAGYLGFAFLVVLGVYMVILALREKKNKLDISRGIGLAMASMAVSLDALAVGFVLGAMGLPLDWSLLAIGTAAFGMTFVGMEFGKKLGQKVEAGAELWSGIILALTGLGLFWEKISGF